MFSLVKTCGFFSLLLLVFIMLCLGRITERCIFQWWNFISINFKILRFPPYVLFFLNLLCKYFNCTQYRKEKINSKFVIIKIKSSNLVCGSNRLLFLLCVSQIAYMRRILCALFFIFRNRNFLYVMFFFSYQKS